MIKTNLVRHEKPEIFIETLNQYIKKAETDGYIIRDIKYSDNGKRYSALLMLVKLNKKE